jgi:hypothetical protein
MLPLRLLLATTNSSAYCEMVNLTLYENGLYKVHLSFFFFSLFSLFSCNSLHYVVKSPAHFLILMARVE